MCRYWNRAHRWGLLAIGLSCVFLASSCGRSKPAEIKGAKLPLFPVTGSVVANGKPLANAEVIFHPVEKFPDSAAQALPQARTDSEGNFKLSTYQEFDGAPVGRYRVTVVWRGENGRNDDPNLLPSKLKDPTSSRLRAKVEEKENALPPLQIAFDVPKEEISKEEEASN